MSNFKITKKEFLDLSFGSTDISIWNKMVMDYQIKETHMSKTVNFIEAVNSGKRFKPVGIDDYWVEQRDTTKPPLLVDILCAVYDDEHAEVLELDKDYINKQFELEEKSITITESEFHDACKRAYNNEKKFWAIDSIKKELGF